MRTLLAGLSFLSLVALSACSYTVEMEQEQPSPAVTTTSEGPAPAGHGMGGMPVGMSPHGGVVPEGPIVIGADLKLVPPEGWIARPPANDIVRYEFAVPAAEGDSQDGRMTVTNAMGSVEANIERWMGQFAQPDGSPTAEKAKVEKLDLSGCTVHLVDVLGTYKESRGMMMSNVVERPGYRMLAAIVVTPEGTSFVKFYGPQKTVDGQAAAFREMIESLDKER